MKSLNLIGQTNAAVKDFQGLMPNELLYIRVASIKNFDPLHLKIILKAAKITSEVILSIPHEEYADEELRNKFFSIGIKGFALRFTHNPEKYLKLEGPGQENAGDRDIIDSYFNYLRMLPAGKDLPIEFQIGDDVRILAPTIAGLYEYGMKWAVLNVEGKPTATRVQQMKGIFEFLRIRGAIKLNLYFPMWNDFIREWDIKTLNTFAGLNNVHIDLSNRCTHSCVFCGLYSPDAIEYVKNKMGEYPETIKTYMKQEIDSEKCLAIIDSLPWTVESIMFGGYGDPLMHKDAVKFIKRARERGFLVQLLSNMEYLEDNDLQELHQLGGKDLNLHFIANVSGGTPDVYVKTRPRQTAKHFEKVVHNLSTLSKLRTENENIGVTFTLMCVVTAINHASLLDVAKLAQRVGATKIWFKPFEYHSQSLAHIGPTHDQMKTMVKSMNEAINYSEKFNIEVDFKDLCMDLISKYREAETYV